MSGTESIRALPIADMPSWHDAVQGEAIRVHHVDNQAIALTLRGGGAYLRLSYQRGAWSLAWFQATARGSSRRIMRLTPAEIELMFDVRGAVESCAKVGVYIRSHRLLCLFALPASGPNLSVHVDTSIRAHVFHILHMGKLHAERGAA